MIYFAQLPSTGAIKIGFSDNVEARLSQLAGHYRERLSLLHVIKGNLDTEREIHERFSHLRLGKTEQFRAGIDLMEFIGKPLLVNINAEAVEAKGYPSPRVQITLDPETRERFKLIQAALPEIKSLSAAIRYVARIAVEHLPPKPS
jgi:hypothetical protein